MADIVTFLVDKVAFPVLSGAGGVGVTIWRFSASVSARLEAVERAWKQFSDHDYPRERNELVAALKTLRQDIAKELNKIQNDDSRSTRERSDARRLHANLSDRVAQMEFRVQGCEKAIQDLNDQFETFAKEQNELWQNMTRTLGQIEGYLRGVATRNSNGPGPFPLK